MELYSNKNSIKKMVYYEARPWFHVFEGDDYMGGFSFADQEEGESFLKSVNDCKLSVDNQRRRSRSLGHIESLPFKTGSRWGSMIDESSSPVIQKPSTPPPKTTRIPPPPPTQSTTPITASTSQRKPPSPPLNGTSTSASAPTFPSRPIRSMQKTESTNSLRSPQIVSVVESPPVSTINAAPVMPARPRGINHIQSSPILVPSPQIINSSTITNPATTVPQNRPNPETIGETKKEKKLREKKGTKGIQREGQEGCKNEETSGKGRKRKKTNDD